MPKKIIPLTDLRIRNAKPAAKSYKLADGGGLYLEVIPNGSKIWRMKYRKVDGKENRLTFGAHPVVTLAEARRRRDEAREHLACGADPAEVRDAAATRVADAARQTFEIVAREWHFINRETWQPNTAKNLLHRLEVDIFGSVALAEPSLGSCKL